MARSEEERPLMSGPSVAGAAASPTKAGKGPTLRGVVVTGFVAIGVFIVAALASRTIMWEDSSLAEETVYESGGDSTNASLYAVSGLINPNNGTHPTLTTTEGCTGGTYVCTTAETCTSMVCYVRVDSLACLLGYGSTVTRTCLCV